MSGTEDKKTSCENTDVPTQAVNPAMLVKAPKLPIKVEFSQDGSRKEQHNDKKKKKGYQCKIAACLLLLQT